MPTKALWAILPGSQPPQPADEKGDEKESKGLTTPIEDNILNDTIVWARSLAEFRGRNADWAERAVRKSISVTASDAAREDGSDLIAEDIGDLLSKIDGSEMQLLDRRANLQTTNAEVINLEMLWGGRILDVLANPPLAFLLCCSDFTAFCSGFTRPAGSGGKTRRDLSGARYFFAMAVLPINYVGLALIVIALAMFVAEAFVFSYGLLSVGGAICLVLGGIMLSIAHRLTGVPFWLLIPVSLATAIISFSLVGSIDKTHHNSPQTRNGLVEETAVRLEKFHSKGEIFHGQVRTHGETWQATSGMPVAKSEGYEINVDDVKHHSPARSEHINIYARYYFNIEEGFKRKGFVHLENLKKGCSES